MIKISYILCLCLCLCFVEFSVKKVSKKLNDNHIIFCNASIYIKKN